MLKSTFFQKHPLLVFQLTGWTAYILVDVFNHLRTGYFEYIPSLIGGVSACILTGLVAFISDKFKQRSIREQVILFALLLFTAIVLWHKVYTVIHTLEDSMTIALHKVLQYSPSQWLKTGYMPLFLFLAWSGFYVGSKWFLAHREQQIELNLSQLKTKHAQLQTLRYQLNPHFLFNILNSIDVSVMSDDKDTAHSMLKHLSRFLRNSLQQGEQDKISLKHEIEIVKDFISIEQIRFGDKLKIELDISQECEGAMLPPMLLQPLIENAIKFAWSQTGQGEVNLLVNKVGFQLIIQITNSKAQNRADMKGTGTGLRNTQERLALVYGDDASLNSEDLSGQFKVELKLPLEVEIS